MLSKLHMTVMSLAADVAPLTCKIINNGFNAFERGEYLLQNRILLHFVFRLSQSSEITLEN